MISDQVTWDDQEFELFGLPKTAETVALTSITDVIHPDDREQLAETAKAVLEGGATSLEEFRVMHSDGSVRWLLGCSDIVQVMGCKTSARLMGLNMDITESKNTEIALRQTQRDLEAANATLKLRIAERTAELEAEAERHAKTLTALAVSQRLESIGQLTGGIAHDFNNLMSVILGNAELLEIEYATIEDASINIDAIKKAVARGSSLTQRLLTFAGKTALRLEAADVAVLIEGLRDMLQRTLGETITIRIKGAPEIWPVLIDRHQFEDAMVNLSINARDAMPQGGTLTIEASDVSITDDEIRKFGDMTSGDYVKVTVTDTGHDISTGDLDKIIDPFFTTKEFGKGSGLDLSMVYGFVAQSNGHFDIDSEVGYGTSVMLYLPRTTEPSAEKPIVAPRSHATAESKCILVVEDDPDARKICVSVLRNQGFDVVEASDGNEAIRQLLEGQRIDLLFTDIILTGELNGAEIAEIAKSMCSDVKVVFTTG